MKRLTSDVQKVMEVAKQLALSKDGIVVPELLLIGMLTIDCYANTILTKLGFTINDIDNEFKEYGSNTIKKQGLDYNSDVRQIFADASRIADNLSNDLIDTQHLLLAISDSRNPALTLLEKKGITFKRLEPIVLSIAYNAPNNLNMPNITIVTNLPNINDDGPDSSNDDSDNFNPDDFVPISFRDFVLKNIMSMMPQDEKPVSRLRPRKNIEPSLAKNERTNRDHGRDSDIDEALKQIGTELTEIARRNEFDPVIGRDKEIKRIIQILTRRTKNNPILIGEPGVGKTAIVEGLATAIVAGNVPETLRGKKLFSLDVGSLVAGTKYRGDFEARLKNALKSIDDGSTILFIDEIHTIVSAGDKEGGLNISNLIKPMLARGNISTIGATTYDEYRKYIVKDSALERRFQTVYVDPPNVEDTISILKGLREKYEAHHKVTITDEALEAAAKFSDRYISDRYLPDKAIDLIDEGASKVRISQLMLPPEIKKLEEQLEIVTHSEKQAAEYGDYEKASKLKAERLDIVKSLDELSKKWGRNVKNTQLIVDAECIAQLVSESTNIPVSSITETESEKLLRLEDILKTRIIGQDDAVSAVSKAVRRSRAGLNNPKRPINSFIFLGPSGVGKTELTNTLATTMFGTDQLLIRLDMSEYMEKMNISRLIGSAPGYVGYEEAGQLTEAVRKKPYSVVLFDEIEKAHPDVFNLLLQILEDGRLTDSHGRVVSFRNTIIIMTSNIGAHDIFKMRSMGFSNSSSDDSYENMKEKMLDSLKKTMRPEFINRIDDIIIFRKLDDDSLLKIAKLLLKQLSERLVEQGFILEFDESVSRYLLKSNNAPEFGARPIRNNISKIVEDKLSELIIADKLKKGIPMIVSVSDKSEIVINPISKE
ncbi:MAG: ATP-dependent Clp protease ATP-binding subunit [Christensenellaceae bacterium]|jgi:ATP-dependent Clp protease ATP-binding subunit ClpC|nr:ATP-dependent Clp protease ATP-binding subunit [Christensenellaceae bacterium]